MQDLQNKIMFCEHLILWSPKRSVNENEVKITYEQQIKNII